MAAINGRRYPIPAGGEHARLRELTDRAARFGYVLIRCPGAPHAWSLLDAEDNQVVLAAETLDEIEAWLRT